MNKDFKKKLLKWLVWGSIDALLIFVLAILMMTVEDNYNWDIEKFMNDHSFPMTIVPFLFQLWFVVNFVIVGLIVYRLVRRFISRSKNDSINGY